MPQELTGREIRRLRSLHGLTQADLAELLNVAQSTVSRWENDSQKPEAWVHQELTAKLAKGKALDDARLLHRVRTSTSMTVLIDRNATILAISPAMRAVSDIEGVNLRQHRVGDVNQIWDHMEKIGFFDGDIASVEATGASVLPNGEVFRYMGITHFVRMADGSPAALYDLVPLSEEEFAAHAEDAPRVVSVADLVSR